MKAVNKKILVRCNLEQKDYMDIAGNTLKCAQNYNPNYRERSPVIAVAEETVGGIAKGDVILAHHNHFYGNSPYWLKDDLFSIPCNKTIFAIIGKDGYPKPVNGNIICKKVDIETEIELPPEERKQYIDRAIVLTNGFGFNKGQLIFVKPYSPYEIVYIYNNIENRVVKVDSDMILGVLK